MNVSSGDTAWLLASSALVMLMTPGVLPVENAVRVRTGEAGENAI